MLNYQKYYVCDCEDKEVTRKLFSALISYSDAFSLLYFRRNEDEKLKKRLEKSKKN